MKVILIFLLLLALGRAALYILHYDEIRWKGDIGNTVPTGESRAMREPELND
jgi:hypothetical protein